MFADLHVVAVISNPERYRSRYNLYKHFEKYVLDSGAKLMTVEAAFGERPHVVTEAGNPNHLQLRTSSQLWHKENMINLGVQRLPSDWKYMAWIDADVQFARPDWVAETIHQLQHFHIVQMFSHAVDLDPQHAPAPNFYIAGPNTLRPASWAYCYVHEIPKANTDLRKAVAEGKMTVEQSEIIRESDGYYHINGSQWYWHPGFAWAIRRDAYDHLGGLVDWNIVGASDYIMAAALTQTLSYPNWVADSYRRWTEEWKARADRYIRGNLGYVPGLILHNWHGRKSDRRYHDRWKILRDNAFDPELDLKRDWQGLWQLTDRSSSLRNDLRLYHRCRNEDSIDV